MTSLLSQLRIRWDQALSAGAAGREWRGVALNTNSQVRVLAGVRDRDNRIAVLMETPLEHAPHRRMRLRAEGISAVDQRANEEGILRLAVTLERPDLREVFEVLVVDLIETAAAGGPPQDSIIGIVRRLEAWQTCLRVRQRGLTREEQAGLTGELAILSLAAEELGLPRAIGIWQGPLDALHDFEAGGIAIEVKTTIGVSQHVCISALDQLTLRGLGRLLLARVRLQEDASGHTLPDQINAIRATLVADFPGGVATFEERLMRAGYLDADAELYSATRTLVDSISVFRVTDDFPRLTRDALPSAIVEAAYSLDEGQLGKYRLDDSEVRTGLRQMDEAYDR